MKQTPGPGEQALRVLLVDETYERATLLTHALQLAGYQIIAHISSSADLLRVVHELSPDIIILDTESPDRDTLEHLCAVSRDQPRPVVMFSDDDNSEKVRQAIQAGVCAYVVDGMKHERLTHIVDVAIAQFNKFQTMYVELQRAESALADRKDIDRAKGILMRQRKWSEEEAYQALRKMAMEKGLKIGEVARQIISVAELLG